MAYNNNDPFADLPDASADPFADLPDASSGGLAASFGSGVDKVQEIGYRALKGFTDVGENPNDYEEGSAGRWVAESIGQGGSLAKFADKGIARNLQEQQAYTPTVGSYKDVDSLGSAASYVGELTAGSIPYMGAALYPPTLFAMGGGLSNEAYEAQEDKSPLRAVASGYGQIALERIGALGSLGKIGGVAKDAATGKVKSVVKSALGEGATEAGQDALAQWGAGASLDELDVDSLQESFVGGAAVGGTIRTGTEAYNATKEKIKPTLSDTDTTDLLSDPEDAQTPVQQTVGGETVDYDPTIAPSAISPIEGETANDWRPNWEFGQNDMPINGQMQPYTYEGELDPFHDIPNSVPVGQVLEAPIIEGEFERPRGLPDRSNVIYGEDGRPMQQAQEFAQQAANNYQPQIEQKDIIFAGDERGVQLKQDGTPFGGKKAVSISKGFKDANAQGLNPSVVQVNGGYGWVAENGDVGLDTGSIGQPSDQQVGSTGTALPGDVRGDNGGRLRDGADGAIRSGDAESSIVASRRDTNDNALNPHEKGVIEAPVSELKLSDDIPQFKSGADQDGVVEPLTGKYDPVGMAPIQVWVRSNGDKEIITGRHRFDLAKRAGVDNIPAQYHYEDEGFTAEDGKRTDAILNIREDKGQVEDYVELFQQDKLTEEDAKELGLLDRATGRTAYRIASSATRETVEAQRSGRITGQAAERIAETAPKDEALQSLALKALMNDQRSITYAENLIRAVKSMRQDNGPEQQTGDLFGFDDSAMREAEDMAKVAATKQRELRTRLNAIRGAAKNPKLAKAEGVNVKDPKSLNKRIEEISTQAKAWDNWETKPELVSEIRNEIGANPLDAQPQEKTEIEQPESIVDENQNDMFGDQEQPTNEAETRQRNQDKLQEKIHNGRLSRAKYLKTDADFDKLMQDARKDKSSNVDSIKELQTAVNLRKSELDTEKLNSQKSEIDRSVNDADKIPAKIEPSLESYNSFMDRVDNADESLTAKDVLDAFKVMRNGVEAIEAELNTMTKEKILKYYRGYDRNGKKAGLAKSAASSIVTDFGFVTTSTGMMTTSGIGREERFNSVQKKLEALTDTDLQNNMKAVKVEQEKRISDMKKRISGAKDPKTLDDFRNAVRIGVSDEFTPEQWAQYDKLHADEKLEQQEKAAVKTVSAVNDDVTYTTAETVHSKNGTPLYVVSLGDRVPSELYKELNAKSKSLGGYYSRYSKDGAIPGFQFKSESDRKNFLSILEGDEVTKTKEDKDKTESLEALADRIEERATGVVNQDRKTNTSRRASMAAGVISNAEAELLKASELRLLATAIKNGEAKYLSKLSTGTERDLIASLWNRLRYNVKGAQADNLLERETINGNARGYKWKQGVSPEQKVRFAEYPLTSMRADSVKRIAQEMMKAKGYKQAAMKFIADAGKLSESDTMNVAGHKYNNKFMQFVRENQDNTYIEDVVKDYSRLARMGITTTPMLRAALLEYNSITDNAKPVKVKNATTEKLKYSSLQGKYKENDFFNSTDTVVETAVNVADIQPGMKVLEPSAGAGHLADGVANVVGIENVKTFELASGLQKFLTDKGYDVTGGDFLEQTPTGDFDRVVMNPPFSKDQEITHIEHAYKFLKPGGRLVAVTSSMAGNRSNKRNKAFLSWMEDIGASEYNLPAGSFKDAINPTDVNSKIIVIDKPAQDTMFKRSDSFTDNSNASTTGNTGAVTLKDANKVIDGIVSNWDGDNRANDFVIADSFEQLPTNIKDAAKQQGAEGQVKGVFHNSKTYLVLDQHTSTTELEETIYHETYGHQGLRKMYGPDLPKKLNQLFVAIGGISGLRVTAKRNGVNLSAYEKGLQQAGTRKDVANQILMDELLAHMQQSNKPSVKRFAMETIGLIRAGLRKMGFAKLAKLNDADLFHILRKSRKAVQTDGKSISGESDVMFSRTNPEESPFILPEETKQERAIRFVQDKLNRVKKAQKVVGESGINTSDSADVYGKESLYYGKVEENFRQLSQEYIEPIADKLAKADIPQVEFDLYLYALHAKERNAYISTINEGMESGSGMTNQEADAIIAAVNASPKRKAFRDANRMVRSMIDKRVESMRDAGLIDEETFASLQDSYENYVPLKGQAKDEGGKPKGTGMGFNIKGKETIAALGRQSKAESPLLHSFIDTQQAIVRGHKNEVGSAMLKLIEEAPNPDLWNAYTTEGPTERKKDSSGKVVEKAMSASTMSALASNPMSEWFATKRDGVTHYIKFEDPLIAQQMKNFGVDNGNAITRTLGMVNRYLSMMSTSLNPEFLVTNLVRDVQTAVFNIAAETEIADGKIKGLDANKFAKQSLKDLPKAFKGIRSVLRDNNTDSEWSQVFDQFRKNGAKTGYFDMKDLDGQERDLQNLMKLESKSQVMKFKDGALKFIEDYNSSVENAIRLSVYKNALDNGISQHKAAVLAKNLTVNFNRKGEAGTWLNSLFLFANAGIQGTANFARAIGTFKVVDGKKKLNLAQKAGVVMAGIAFSMSVMNRMLSDDDDDGESYWDKIPEHVKERNFVLMHPNGKDYFTLPMPYGYNVFANMGTAAESLMSGGKVSENAAFLVKAVMGSFVPLGLSEGKDPLETAIKTVTPQIAKPFVDISTNTNFFGSQIYSEANEMYGDKRSDSALGRDSTNEAFKSAAKGLNAVTGGSEYQSGFIDPHPETLRYIAEYLGGGAGATVLRTAETIARGTKGEFEASKTPFIRKVYGKLTDYSDQTDFYNRADEVSKYKAEFSSLRGKERYEFKKENEDLIRLEPMADQTKKSLKQLRNRKKLLAKREGAEEKIKQIDEKMETLVDRFNKRYNEAMEKR